MGLNKPAPRPSGNADKAPEAAPEIPARWKARYKDAPVEAKGTPGARAGLNEFGKARPALDSPEAKTIDEKNAIQLRQEEVDTAIAESDAAKAAPDAHVPKIAMPVMPAVPPK